MKKPTLGKVLALLLTVILLSGLLPVTALAADPTDSNGDGYNDNDMNKLQAFLNIEDAARKTNLWKINPTGRIADPSTWTGVTWTDDTIKSIQTIYIPDKGLTGVLDLSDAVKLESLYCWENELTGLNLSGAVSLKSVDCHYNQLSAINLTGTSALTLLFCTNNNLSSLNCSSSTAIAGMSCGNNPLKTLRANLLGHAIVVSSTSAGTVGATLSGNNFQLIASPVSAESHFANWTEGATVLSVDADYTIDLSLSTAGVPLDISGNFSHLVSFVTNVSPLTGTDKYVDDGNLVTPPADPTRAGYAFGGWYTVDGHLSLVSLFDFNTPIHESILLLAKWTRIYSVSATASGGSVTPSKTNAIAGDTINLTVTPDAGKQYKSGSLKYNDGTEHAIAGTSFTMPAANVTVTAEFEDATTAPVITSVSSTTVTDGVGGTFQVTATGSGTMTYSLSDAPGFVSINSSTGLITITDDVSAGGFDINAILFKVKADNGVSPAAAQDFTLHVVTKPEIHLPRFMPGTVGDPYEVQIPVTGTATISWSFVSGRLPTGLTLSADGKLSGTPTTAGTYNFEIKAENSHGYDSEAYSLTIQNPAITGTVVLSLDRETGAVTASVTGGNASSLTYAWSGGATGTDATVTPTPGTAATCTVTASTFTGSLTASATVYKAVMSVSGNVASDSVGDISATLYGQDGDTVTIPYTLSKTTGSQFDGLQLNTNSLNALRDWLLANDVTRNGSTSYTITAADAVGGDITIRITFSHRYNLTMEGGGTGSALAGITAAPMRSVYDAGSWVNINAGTKNGYAFSGWTTSNGGTFGSAASAVTTFTTPLADTVITANWTQNTTPAPSGGGGSTTTATPTRAVSGTTATTTVTPTVINGAVKGAVTADQMRDALKQAQAAAGTNGTPNVEIQIRDASGASSVGTTIPHASMQALVSGGVGALTVSGPTGSVSFDAAALKTISGAPGDMTVTVAQMDASTLSDAVKAIVGSHPVFAFSVTSGGSTVSQFGGDVTVSVPYTPAPGEDPNAIVIYYIAADGTPTPLPDARYDAATGTVVFTTTHFSTYAVGYNKVSFTDVSTTAWYADAVSFLSARGVTSGTTASTFSPDATLTRGQFVTMLLRAYGVAAVTNPTDNFTDAGSTYYTGYLAAAKTLGITSGVGDNKFAPDNAITRQEMFTLMYNALKVLNKLPSSASGKTLADFTDIDSVASWATDAMKALVKAGTVTGSNGTLNPTGTTTRAEMAQVLYNLLGK